MNDSLRMVVTALLASSITLADCPNAVELKVGDAVRDCDRIGLSRAYNKEVKEQLAAHDYDQKIISEQKRVIELKDLRIKEGDERAELWKGEATRSREAYDREREHSDRVFWVGMGVGIGITALAAWIVKEVAR
jgi:hypothetical protein